MALVCFANQTQTLSIIEGQKVWRSFGSSAGDGKRFLESNSSSIPGTYFKLGYVKVSRIEEAFDSRSLLPLTALDPIFHQITYCCRFLDKYAIYIDIKIFKRAIVI